MNTFGARFWTDGKMETPMLPRYPPLVRCRHCATLLWLPAAEEVGTEHPGEVGTPGVEDPPAPTAEDLLEASRTPPAGTQDEVFIRIEAWHAANELATEVRDVQVLNWGSHRDLLPEVPGLRWASLDEDFPDDYAEFGGEPPAIYTSARSDLVYDGLRGL